MTPRTILAAILAILSGSAHAGQVFQIIDVPGAVSTQVTNISDTGQISGFYWTAGSNQVNNFLDTNGVFTTVPSNNINVPGMFLTNPEHTNNLGTTIGYCYDAVGSHGFLDTSTGNITVFDIPGTNQLYSMGINDYNSIVGFDGNGDRSTPAGTRGWFLDSGVYTAIVVQGAIGTQAWGINDADYIVGFYEDDAGQSHGFLYINGSYTTIDPPGAASYTTLTSINDYDQIGGYYQDDKGVTHGFVMTTVVPEPSALVLAMTAVITVLIAKVKSQMKFLLRWLSWLREFNHKPSTAKLCAQKRKDTLAWLANNPNWGTYDCSFPWVDLPLLIAAKVVSLQEAMATIMENRENIFECMELNVNRWKLGRSTLILRNMLQEGAGCSVTAFIPREESMKQLVDRTMELLERRAK